MYAECGHSSLLKTYDMVCCLEWIPISYVLQSDQAYVITWRESHFDIIPSQLLTEAWSDNMHDSQVLIDRRNHVISNDQNCMYN